MNTPTPLSCIESFVNARVLCVGDVMVDHFAKGTLLTSETGTAGYFSEPVLRFESQKSVLGAAAYVFSNLAHLQCGQCQLISVVGNDSGFKTLSNLLEKLPGNPPAILIKDESRKTSQVTRYSTSDGLQNLLRVVQSDTHELSPELEDLLISYVRQTFPAIDVIIFTDHGKGVLTHRVLQTILPEARSRGILTLVDPRGSSMEKYRGAYLLKPNLFELAAIMPMSMPMESEKQIIRAALEIKNKFNFEAILVTRDENGMTLVTTNEQESYWEPSHAQVVVDDVGAGDTVIAVLGIALSLKLPIQTALHLCSRAAAIAIAKPGTSPLSQEELKYSFQYS